MRWSVVENTPGYLPDSEPSTFDEYADARQYAIDLVLELKEQGYDLQSVVDAPGIYSAFMLDHGKIHDLGRVIEVAPWIGDEDEHDR